MPESPSAHEITNRAKSNLAFALACLPRQRRDDMKVFYAFCRIVDDIADDPAVATDEKRRQLENWSQVILGEREPDHELERIITEVLRRNAVDPNIVQEIIRGMEMDLEVVRYETYADLETYCYRVASAVGLASIRIFGCQAQESETYAVELGHALQITNILRDVGEDLRTDDRIYLPQEDLERFGVQEGDLRAASYTDAFQELMHFEAARAEERYDRAQLSFPESDRVHLRASELMRTIYHALLEKMRHDGFRVLDRRYRLTKLQKMGLMMRFVILGS